MYGVIDFSLIDTMPGGQGAFAPPAGWQGDYRQLDRKSVVVGKILNKGGGRMN